MWKKIQVLYFYKFYQYGQISKPCIEFLTSIVILTYFNALGHPNLYTVINAGEDPPIIRPSSVVHNPLPKACLA